MIWRSIKQATGGFCLQNLSRFITSGFEETFKPHRPLARELRRDVNEMNMWGKARETRSGFTGNIMTGTRGDSLLQTSAQETLLHNLAAKDQNRVSILRMLFVLAGVMETDTKARTGVGKSAFKTFACVSSGVGELKRHKRTLRTDYVTSATSKSKTLALEPSLWCNVQPNFHTWPPAGGDTVLYCAAPLCSLGAALAWSYANVMLMLSRHWRRRMRVSFYFYSCSLLYTPSPAIAAPNSPLGASRAYTQNKLARSKYISNGDSPVWLFGKRAGGWGESPPQDLHLKQQFSMSGGKRKRKGRQNTPMVHP